MIERGTSTSAFRMTLVLTGIAVAGLLVKIVLDAMRGSDECGTAITGAINVATWVALVSAALAFVFGIVAMFERSGGVVWIVAAMVVALVVGVPIVTASTWGTYACSGGAA
jgi:hypothetical protein